MNRAKEYYKNRDSQEVGGFIGRIQRPCDCKIMNHKTLEDVEAWVKETPIFLTKQLNLDTPKEISKWLMALSNKLKDLRL